MLVLNKGKLKPKQVNVIFSEIQWCLTYSLAFLPSQNAVVPYTIGAHISTSLSLLVALCKKSESQLPLNICDVGMPQSQRIIPSA